MAKWMPCKRRDFIKKLRKLGFKPPEPGGLIIICVIAHIHSLYQVTKNILSHKSRCFLMRLNVELVRKSPFNSGKIFRKVFHYLSTIMHGKKNQQRYSKVRRFSPYCFIHAVPSINHLTKEK